SPYSGRAFAVADQAQRRTSPVSGFAMRTRPRTTSASEADLKRRVLGLGRTGREQRVLDLGLLQPADHMVDHLAHRAAEIGEQALLLGRGVADKEAGAVTEIRTLGAVCLHALRRFVRGAPAHRRLEHRGELLLEDIAVAIG